MNSLQGHFLVASPHLHDTNFAQTVVLIVEHQAGGALGLVVNRVSGRTVEDIWPQISSDPAPSQRPIHLGGPVPGPLSALHGSAHLADTSITAGVFFSSHAQHVHSLLVSDNPPLRLFTGYAGWGAGQLEAEVKVGGWHLVQSTPEAIFADDVSDLWQRQLHRVGESLLRDTLRLDELPDDPSVN